MSFNTAYGVHPRAIISILRFNIIIIDFGETQQFKCWKVDSKPFIDTVRYLSPKHDLIRDKILLLKL